MPFSGKRKFPYHLTVYVPSQKEKAVRNFVEAFQARNESASQKILDFIENYDNLVIFNRAELEHILSLIKEDSKALPLLKSKLSNAGRVNPQTRLPRYQQAEAPQPETPEKCWFHNCNQPCVAVAVHDSGREMPVCELHMRLVLGEPRWKIKGE